MLIKLPNGNYVEPATVFAIVAAEARPADRNCLRIPDRVIVRYGHPTNSLHEIIACPDWESAQRMRIEIAAQCWKAMAGIHAATEGDTAGGSEGKVG